jgi:cell division protein FtsB
LEKRYTELIENNEAAFEDDELLQQIAARRKVRDAQKRRKKRLSVVAFVLIFVLVSGLLGRDIIRLKAENRALKKQQIALEKQRDELKEELTRVDDPDYIREQARKQLRLLNPGEILFNFDDGSAVPAGSGDETSEDGSGGADE